MRHVQLLTAVLIGTLAVARVGAEPINLGHHDDVTVVPPERTLCPGELVVAHSGAFDNGYCWNLSGTTPPYYGAFGEAYEEGSGSITCASFWLTRTGTFYDPPVDIYVWEGGISSEPGLVLWVLPDIGFEPPGMWPTVTQHDVRINEIGGLDVEGEFTVGYWVDFSGSPCQFFIAVDEDNPGGHPWTCVAPGIGYPTGWQHPGLVWGVMHISMGIGVTLERGTADVGDAPVWGEAESPTWGRIKVLFER